LLLTNSSQNTASISVFHLFRIFNFVKNTYVYILPASYAPQHHSAFIVMHVLIDVDCKCKHQLKYGKTV